MHHRLRHWHLLGRHRGARMSLTRTEYKVRRIRPGGRILSEHGPYDDLPAAELQKRGGERTTEAKEPLRYGLEQWVIVERDVTEWVPVGTKDEQCAHTYSYVDRSGVPRCTECDADLPEERLSDVPLPGAFIATPHTSEPTSWERHGDYDG